MQPRCAKETFARICVVPSSADSFVLNFGQNLFVDPQIDCPEIRATYVSRFCVCWFDNTKPRVVNETCNHKTDACPTEVNLHDAVGASDRIKVFAN